MQNIIKPFRILVYKAIPILLLLSLIITICEAQTSQPSDCQRKKRKGQITAAYIGSQHNHVGKDGEAAKRILVLDHIESNLKKPSAVSPPTDIWLDLKLPIEDINPIDCDVEYECTGAKFFLKQLSESEWKSTASRLDELSNKPMFGCYVIENDFENKQEQTRCRYIRKLSFAENNFQGDAAKLIKTWRENLKNEKILNVWFEGGARVTSKGLPLEKMCTVRPIAILTDRNSYLFIEEVSASADFARQIAVTGRRFFSFRDTPNLKRSIINVMNIFNEELAKNFAANPILANLALDERMRPGETIFKRDRQKSRVIGRENWLPEFFNSAYEISTYTMKWFSSGKTVINAGTDHGFFGKGAEKTFGPNIFVEIEQNFLISSDGTNYRETITPSDLMNNYLSLYKRAILDAFTKSLRGTCQRLSGKGMMTNGVCEIRGDVQ